MVLSEEDGGRAWVKRRLKDRVGDMVEEAMPLYWCSRGRRREFGLGRDVIYDLWIKSK